jgi:hypothetical protein
MAETNHRREAAEGVPLPRLWEERFAPQEAHEGATAQPARMPGYIKLIAIFAAIAFQVVTAPSTKAADLGVSTVHRVLHGSHWRFVADYDGTPIRLEHRRAVLARGPEGIARVVAYESDAYPSLNIYDPRFDPIPTRYFNGEPIRGYVRHY